MRERQRQRERDREIDSQCNRPTVLILFMFVYSYLLILFIFVYFAHTSNSKFLCLQKTNKIFFICFLFYLFFKCKIITVSKFSQSSYEHIKMFASDSICLTLERLNY